VNIAELEPGRRYRIRWTDPAPGSELDYGCPLAEYIGPMHFDAEGSAPVYDLATFAPRADVRPAPGGPEGSSWAASGWLVHIKPELVSAGPIEGGR
jgi:hypothetical protein